MQVTLECVVDRAHRVVYEHRDQKLQKPNSECEELDKEDYKGGPSIHYKYLHVRIVGYQDLPKDSTYTMIWNPGAEARPDHINRLHGTNQDRKVCMVIYRPGTEGDVTMESERVARQVPCDSVARDLPGPPVPAPQTPEVIVIEDG